MCWGDFIGSFKAVLDGKWTANQIILRISENKFGRKEKVPIFASP